MNRSPVTAIILAGGFSKRFFEAFGEGFKALLTYKGQMLWEITEQAAGEAGIVRRIVIGEWIADFGTEYLNSGECMMLPGLGSLQRNLCHALQAASSEYVVIMTADIPRLTGETFSRLLASFLAAGEVGLACPVIPVELCEKEHPGAKRTSVKLAEGRFTLGNIFYARKKTLWKNLWKIGIMLFFRKMPKVLALILGPKFVLGYLDSTLTLVDLEEKASKMLGAKVRAIICEQPGDSAIGDDIDNPEQADILDIVRAMS